MYIYPMYVCGNLHKTMFVVSDREGDIGEGVWYDSLEEAVEACRKKGAEVCNVEEVLRGAAAMSMLKA